MRARGHGTTIEDLEAIYATWEKPWFKRPSEIIFLALVLVFYGSVTYWILRMFWYYPQVPIWIAVGLFLSFLKRPILAIWKATIAVGNGTGRQRQTRQRTVKPPVNASFLFYLFLDSPTADAFIGDIEERYPRMLQKFGKRRADLWVWSQTIRSLGPIIWAWGKKAAGITALYEAWIKLRS